jgi:hypothetical protein
MGRNLPEISVLASMESYASIELGVAKLEIMYQEDLKCIAMTSDGWRCQEIIEKEQLLKARELLTSSIKFDAEPDFEVLSRLVLCTGHGLGELPQMYSERWATFAEKRLSKEQAMSKSNAEFWMSVQFLHNRRSEEFSSSKEMRRPRSASNMSAHQREKGDFVRIGRTGGDSLWPPLHTPLDFQVHEFEFSWPNNSSNPEFTTPPRNWDFLESWPIPGRLIATNYLTEC